MHEQVNFVWYILTAISSILATLGIMYFLTWLHDKKYPANDLEWLDKHMNKDHYYPDPHGKGHRVGKLVRVEPLKGNRAKNKPNYEFTFREGNSDHRVHVNADWSLKK
jgi:hypothetical protein